MQSKKIFYKELLLVYVTRSAMVLFLIGIPILSAASQEVEVFESEVGLDQMVTEKPPLKTEEKTLTPSDPLTMINQSLKNVMEENKKFAEENKAMEAELRRLRGENEIRTTRITSLTQQRDDLQGRIDRNQELQKKQEEEITELKKILAQREAEVNQRIKTLEEKIAKEEEEEKKAMESLPLRVRPKEDIARRGDLKAQAHASLKKFEENTKKASSQLAKLNQENKKLKLDSTKLHYNLANIFFEQGKYDRAAKEYKKLVELMPEDPSVHYNLAFVSGEFLSDYKTALAHYQKYLYLNPNAEDVALVQEKILEAQLVLKTKINSIAEDSLPKQEFLTR